MNARVFLSTLMLSVFLQACGGGENSNESEIERVNLEAFLSRNGALLKHQPPINDGGVLSYGQEVELNTRYVLDTDSAKNFTFTPPSDGYFVLKLDSASEEFDWQCIQNIPKLNLVNEQGPLQGSLGLAGAPYLPIYFLEGGNKHQFSYGTSLNGLGSSYNYDDGCGSTVPRPNKLELIVTELNKETLSLADTEFIIKQSLVMENVCLLSELESSGGFTIEFHGSARLFEFIEPIKLEDYVVLNFDKKYRSLVPEAWLDEKQKLSFEQIFRVSRDVYQSTSPPISTFGNGYTFYTFITRVMNFNKENATLELEQKIEYFNEDKEVLCASKAEGSGEIILL